jgi:hypothetical protein
MKKVWLLMTLIGGMACFTGCATAPRQTSIEIQQEATFPTEMTATVPQPLTGTLAQSAKTQNAWLLTYEGITETEYIAYTEALTQKGWELSFSNSDFSKSFTNGSSRLDITLKDDKCMMDYTISNR